MSVSTRSNRCHYGFFPLRRSAWRFMQNWHDFNSNNSSPSLYILIRIPSLGSSVADDCPCSLLEPLFHFIGPPLWKHWVPPLREAAADHPREQLVLQSRAPPPAAWMSCPAPFLSGAPLSFHAPPAMGALGSPPKGGGGRPSQRTTCSPESRPPPAAWMSCPAPFLSGAPLTFAWFFLLNFVILKALPSRLLFTPFPLITLQFTSNPIKFFYIISESSMNLRFSYKPIRLFHKSFHI